MDIGSILAGVALLLLTAAFVALPLVQHSGKRISEEERQSSELQAGRDRVLFSLQELEMDFNTGKVTESDYLEQREALMQEGAGILRQIDSLQGGGQTGIGGTDFEDEIEAAVARARSENNDGGSQGFCPSCGSEVMAGDLFCIRCGNTLTEGEGQA
jgi:hypothetical protein